MDPVADALSTPLTAYAVALRSPPFGTHPQLKTLSLDARLEMAGKRVGCGTDSNDIEADTRFVFSLFDVETDINNHRWLNLLGIASSEPKSSFYNIDFSFDCYNEAALLGSCAAENNLGHNWLDGSYGRIDVDRARDWFVRAVNHNHGCASSSLVSILSADVRYGDPQEKRFNDEVVRILQMGADRGGPFASIALGARELTGNGVPQNTDKGLARYKELFNDSYKGCGSSYPKAHVAARLALRQYLNGNFDAAESWLKHLPSESHSPEIRYHLNNVAARLIYRVNELKAAHALSGVGRNAHPKWIEFEHARELFYSVCTGKRQLSSLVKDIEQGVIPATFGLNDILWAVCDLAGQEHWPDRHVWSKAWLATQLRLVGLSHSRAVASTNDLGPVFNKTSDGFHPIPGAYLSNADDQFDERLRWRALKKIIGRGDGTVELITRPDGRFYFDTYDAEIAWVLAFSDPKGVIWPQFSLEPHDKLTPDRDRWSLERKEWTPAWLAHTAWGKTMYAADTLLGKFGGSPDTYIQLGVSATDAASASSIVNSLRFAGGAADGDWSRVMLYPKSFYRDTDAQQWACGRQISCVVHALEMAVLGADCVVEADGTEDRSLNVNNNAYSAGRHGNLLTDHFDETARLIPVFERMRQLDILLYGLADLRKRGFRPNARVMQHITETRRILEARPALPISERIAL